MNSIIYVRIAEQLRINAAARLTPSSLDNLRAGLIAINKGAYEHGNLDSA